MKQQIKCFLRRTPTVTLKDMGNTFRHFPNLQTRPLMIHSALSHCGYIPGGPETLLKAISDWSPSSMVVMPTHTYCYPSADHNSPVFDVQETASVVGKITDYFWRQPGAVRSIHPTHSLAAMGKGNTNLCEGHELCDTPCGRGTPYEKLIRQDAGVLMFGVTMNVYTFFHTAEDAAAVPYLYEPKLCELRFKNHKGEIITMKMRRQNMSLPRRFTDMDDWLEQKKLLQKIKLGSGILMFIPHAAAVHEAVLKELNRDPFFLAVKDAKREKK